MVVRHQLGSFTIREGSIYGSAFNTWLILMVNELSEGELTRLCDCGRTTVPEKPRRLWRF